MSKHVIIVGGVALGPKAACRLKRLEPDTKVTLIDQSSRISYGGCGIPYFISGEVSTIEELQSTPYHVIRDTKFFKESKDVDVLTSTRVNSIDRAAKTVAIENLITGEKSTLHYDKLVIATGATPNVPPLPGVELDGVTACTNLDQADYIHKAVTAGKVNNAVIIGAGFIGLEVAVALVDMWGINTTVIELQDQVLPSVLSSNLAKGALADLEKNGISVVLGDSVQGFEGKDGKVTHVITGNQKIEADLVVMSIGFSPNTKLAQEAGIECMPRGAIIVDDYLRTNDPDIYAGGDCISIKNLITGEPAYFPLGSLANRQGRVLGTNLAGGNVTFKGAIGSWCVKLFDMSAAGCGLSVESAKRAGFDAMSAYIEQVDRAHFYPESHVMGLEVVVDKKTRRVLGLQGMSTGGDALVARIDAAVGLITAGGTLDDLSNVEVAYSPPFASAMDIINAVANVADNILAGSNNPITASEFYELWKEKDKGEFYVIDTRVPVLSEPMQEKYPGLWFSFPTENLQDRIQDIPKDRPLILNCSSGLRAYDAQVVLARNGISNFRSIEGGMGALSRLNLVVE